MIIIKNKNAVVEECINAVISNIKVVRIINFLVVGISSVFIKSNKERGIKARERLNGVANHNPIKFTSEGREARKIIENIAIKKFFVNLYINKKRNKLERTANNAGRNLFQENMIFQDI